MTLTFTTNIVRFTEADIHEMRRLGHVKLANAEALGTPHINRFRRDRIQGYVDGFKGEWAVASLLGLARTGNVSGRADDGWDLVVDGLTLDARYTPRRNGRLFYPVNRPPRAHVLILSVAGPVEDSVEVIGGITADRFREICEVRDWGYGDTMFCDQRRLTPWADLVVAL